jgi:hypothetical protein
VRNLELELEPASSKASELENAPKEEERAKETARARARESDYLNVIHGLEGACRTWIHKPAPAKACGSHRDGIGLRVFVALHVHKANHCFVPLRAIVAHDLRMISEFIERAVHDGINALLHHVCLCKRRLHLGVHVLRICMADDFAGCAKLCFFRPLKVAKMIDLLLFLQKQNLAYAVYQFGSVLSLPD